MIHATAIISPVAKIGTNVNIGPYTIIHDDVVIGAGSTIGSHCEIGYPSSSDNDSPLVIGESSQIRSHSIFYQGSTFGQRLVTGHRVTVRENTRAGENLQIGTLSDIQGTCDIGDYVRIHSGVFIAKNARIGNFVWLFPHVILTNDPRPPNDVMIGVTIEDFAAIAAGSIVLPGVTIGNGALIGAHSTVTRDVAPDTVATGSPAKFICAADEIKLKDGSEESAYPWRRHFHRGYPNEVVEEWIREFS